MSLPFAWSALDGLFHFGPAMHHLERTFPPGNLSDWVSTLMLNVLWLVPLLAVIFLFINRPVAARAGNPPHRENRSPGGMAGCPRVDNRENRMARGITSAKYPS